MAELEEPIDFWEIPKPLMLYLEALFGKSVDVLTPVGVRAIRDPRVATDIRKTVVYA